MSRVEMMLADELRVDITSSARGAHARVFCGARELKVDSTILRALAQLLTGQLRGTEQEALARAGALVPAPGVSEPVPERLSLRAGVALSLQVGPAILTLPGVDGPRVLRVSPRDPLVEAFVMPTRLAALHRLHERLSRTWIGMMQSAWDADRALDPTSASEALAALARRELEADFALQGVLQVADEAPLRLEPLVPLQEAEIQYPLGALYLYGDPKPSVAQRQPRHGVRIEGLDELRDLGVLLGLLTRGAHGLEVRDLLGDSGVVQRTLLQLIGLGMVVAPPLLAPWPLAAGEVVHLGHGTLLADLGDARVLIDPFLPPPSRRDLPGSPRVAELGPIDLILLTHADRADVQTLLELNKTVPIHIPAAPPISQVGPRLAPWLRALGFDHVHETQPGEHLTAGRSRVTALPFKGRARAGQQSNGLGWLLALEGGAALIAADGGAGMIEAMAERGVRASTVFSARRSLRTAALRQGWSALITPADRWLRPLDTLHNDSETLAGLVRAAGAEQLVLYQEEPAPWPLYGEDPGSLGAPSPIRADATAAARALRLKVPAEVRLAGVGDRYHLGGPPRPSKEGK